MNAKEIKLNVLVVDDEKGMCLAAEKVLNNFSVVVEDLDKKITFKVDSVFSGEEYLKKIKEKKYDLVLVDYKLPDYSGMELIEHTIKNNKDVLIIMITAYGTFETAVQATKLGAHDFLAKPFTPEELRYSIRKAVINLTLTRHAKLLEEERKKIRFQFISVLSHELKAPISAVEGYVNILKKQYSSLSDEDYLNMLDRTQIRLDGMKKLIFDLLDLTRIESGEKKRVIEKVDVVNVVKDSVDMFSEISKNKNVKIKLEADSSVELNADKSELNIIFNNLISNAIKYNKDDGLVNIKLSKNADMLNITVSDTGIGIDSEDCKMLFNDFVRIKNEQTMKITGSGLGLSTVKKLCKLYDGDVWVKSERGIGSNFFVKLKDIQNQ